MIDERLACGVFLGSLSRSIAAGDFQIDLRTATLPPEAVKEHGHDEGHFIFTLADGYRSLASPEPLRRGALIYNPPGVEHRDCYDQAGGGFLAVSAPDLPGRAGDMPWPCSPRSASRASNGSSRRPAWPRAAADSAFAAAIF